MTYRTKEKSKTPQIYKKRSRARLFPRGMAADNAVHGAKFMKK